LQQKICPGGRGIRVLSPFLQNSLVIYLQDLPMLVNVRKSMLKGLKKTGILPPISLAISDESAIKQRSKLTFSSIIYCKMVTIKKKD